eukprot:scaffold635645_cov15-Prasinocladus_malaysianus.AAC.1
MRLHQESTFHILKCPLFSTSPRWTVEQTNSGFLPQLYCLHHAECHAERLLVRTAMNIALYTPLPVSTAKEEPAGYTASRRSRAGL